MKPIACALVLAGCWRGAPHDEVLSQTASDSDLVMTQQGLGPFNARTIAKLPELQAAAASLMIRPQDLGGEAGVVFDVLRGSEKVAYVVPDDAPGWTDDEGRAHQYASTMFAVFAVSPTVRVAGRSWRVGAPLDDIARLEACECWGDHDVTACFSHASHIQLVFERPCDEAQEAGPRAMLGKPISRIMWKRELAPAAATEE